MVSDVIRERPFLFLGSRLKRIGESMQADVLKVVEQAGLPVQPAQQPQQALQPATQLAQGEKAHG